MRNGETAENWGGESRSLISTIEQADLNLTSCRVLMVDDEPAILSVLLWAVQDMGCAVTTAHGGQAALDKLCKECFDVLITDLIMPDLDGFFLLKMAKKLAPEMKVVVMTGSPELVPYIGCPLDGLLVKPFGMNTLKTVIAKCAGGVTREEEQKAKSVQRRMERKRQ